MVAFFCIHLSSETRCYAFVTCHRLPVLSALVDCNVMCSCIRRESNAMFAYGFSHIFIGSLSTKSSVMAVLLALIRKMRYQVYLLCMTAE